MPVLRELKDEINVLTLAALQNSQFLELDSQITQTANYKCDGCNVDITGFRYSCLTCHDFDPCSSCASAADDDGGQRHPHHPMIRSTEPEPALGLVNKTVLKRIKEMVKAD